MKRSRGYALLDALLGLFCVVALTVVVRGLYQVRKSFVYDPQCEEMRNLWENTAYTEIFIPKQRKTEEEPEPEPDLPSLNS